MRKVFAVLAGLILSAFIFACSEDETTVVPPTPVEFEISTTSIPDGLTCSPYKIQLEARGGTEPYTWTLAVGSDPLPEGITLTADGEISGLEEVPGEYSITVSCTDNSSTPETVEQAYTLNIDVPANPSLAVFFDGQATDCSAETAAFTPLDCHIYIMLEESDIDCCRACEFKIRLTDADDNDLELGTQYTHINLSYPDYVGVSMGDPFGGVAVSFSRPLYAYNGPVHVASFSLLLLENLSELTFKFEPNPSGGGGHLGVATCEDGYPIVDVSGRESVVNH
jgi:hypothetical protein